MSIGNGRSSGANNPELRVEDLSVAIATPAGRLHAVSGVSFSVNAGETLCLVGESGCGKTLTALSILGLLPANATVSARAVTFRGRDLRTLDARALADLRGDRIAMIFQDPMTALNPVYTIGNQLIETYQRHRGGSTRAAWARAEYLLERCGVSQPAVRLRQYPHELSGGLRQRMMIAMALMCEPTLIIADEPTTALDVTIQAQIMALLKDLRREFGMALVLITHDLGVVAQVADRVAVMYAGEIVETGTAFDIFAEPLHPYTRGLLACVPSGSRAETRRLGTIPGLVPTMIGTKRGCSFRNRCAFAIAACAQDTSIALETRAPGREVRCIRSAELSAGVHMTAAHHDTPRPEAANGNGTALLVCRSVEKTFEVSGLVRKSQPIRAVDGVELDVRPGEVLAIVGESGSGKTTLGRILLGLMQPSGGSILLNNKPLAELNPRDIARKVQPVFQDPFASLNPRKTVAQIIEFPLSVQGIGSRAERRDRVAEISQRVGLARRLLDSYPIQMSGGQRQRVAIARALVVQPDLVILDEPTSALDVSIQAQILNLLQDLQERLSLTYVFISHDMGVVRYLADRVAVMYRGRIVETGPVERIFDAPQNDYTKSLLGAVLRPDPSQRPLV
ncbi:MAG: ABC transporter ATP-binding protein [Xanthobacteraceae bacterium]|nr:ABC transporter ATP-binding protein [Xanthobacteraceae bacterium]